MTERRLVVAWGWGKLYHNNSIKMIGENFSMTINYSSNVS
jgi:hypothetical protein